MFIYGKSSKVIFELVIKTSTKWLVERVQFLFDVLIPSSPALNTVKIFYTPNKSSTHQVKERFNSYMKLQTLNGFTMNLCATDAVNKEND